MKAVTTILLAVALAGCGKRGAQDGNGFVAAAPQNEAQVEAKLGGIVAVGGPGPVAKPAPGVPVVAPPRPADVRRDARTFPTAFQGRWGLTAADCDLSRIDDATGVMKIEPEKVAFYEASATVRAMPAKSAYKLVADLDFRGDGKSWQRRERFALQVAGTALLRTEPARTGTPARTFRYERC